MRPSPVPEDRLLVLLYHNVGPSPSRAGLGAHWTEPEALRAQIRWLRAAGHTFVDAQWGADWVAQASQPVPGVGSAGVSPAPPSDSAWGGLPARPAAANRPEGGLEARPTRKGREAGETPAPIPRPTLITFDDGLANLYTHALPILEQERVPALIFLVAGRIGGLTDWEAEPRWRGNRLLTWEQAREMQERGVTFGSHTLTHPHLTALPPPAWRRELVESKQVLEQRLARPVATLAYPYGDFSPEIGQAALEAGYRTCFSTIPGLNTPQTDSAALRRMNVRRHAGLWQFRRKVGKMARRA